MFLSSVETDSLSFVFMNLVCNTKFLHFEMNYFYKLKLCFIWQSIIWTAVFNAIIYFFWYISAALWFKIGHIQQ